jgi:hypothetical protein
VILRNDAVGALSALRKGSFSSTFLQQCAMRACHLQRAIRCHTLHLHAPGQTLLTRASMLCRVTPQWRSPDPSVVPGCASGLSPSRPPSAGPSPSTPSLPRPMRSSHASSPVTPSPRRRPRTLSLSAIGTAPSIPPAACTTASRPPPSVLTQLIRGQSSRLWGPGHCNHPCRPLRRTDPD